MSRVAIVTGSSRGAGKAIALELGRAGWTVFVTGRSTRGHPDAEGIGGTVEETAEGVDAAGGRGIAIVCDHTRLEDINALAARISQTVEPLELLVNNAWGGTRDTISRPSEIPSGGSPPVTGMGCSQPESVRLSSLRLALSHSCSRSEED